MNRKEIEVLLNRKVKEFNHPSFIPPDPISIPHLFNKRQDIEIAGFFASIFAWGNRTTIIRKSLQLMELMDNSPYQFIISHKETDLKRMLQFRHRTFNVTDLLYFILFLKHHYSRSASLETAFSQWVNRDDAHVGKALTGFHDYFFSLEDAPVRTRKHIATPARNSTCKRLNMYLRWMVRKDDAGVDFGLWNKIRMDQLICPVDVHVARVARRLKLIKDKQVNWNTALSLTNQLKKFDPSDPVKYDFALFGMGVNN